MTETKHSPLDAEHRAMGAHMGAFAGWEMPISYRGTVSEHTAVRTGVGVFDVSHLGKLMAIGPGARDFLDLALSNRMSDLEPGRARYTLMLTEDAGIVDDMIVYTVEPERLLVVPNASNVDEVEQRMRAILPSDVSLEPMPLATIAIQGPRSREVLDHVVPGVPELKYMRCAAVGSLVVARSGYTGEHGYEVFAPGDEAVALWRATLAAGAEPCGLGARDTLRLEMGYPLHGNDIDPGTTPRDAGLEWAVAAGKHAFTGKEAYEGRAQRRQLVGLRMEDRVIPRHGSTVFCGERPVGTCTSGTFSPTLKMGIALASVEIGSLAEHDTASVDVRGKWGKAVVVRPPFVGSSPK